MLKHHGKEIVTWVSLALLSICVAACASRKTVYIPPEWQTPPPAATAEQKSKTPAQPQPPRTSSDSQQFVLKPPPAIREAEVPQTAEPKPAPAPTEKKEAQPQHLASMHLVEQAKAALAQGKRDSAISLFEQAVQVDVYNGEAFFGLARAWKMKGARDKAVEFARKAEILFQDEPVKLKEVYLFEANIYKDLGDKTAEEIYRRKASRLQTVKK
jgi:Flp pilus assembly protein TadD